MTTTDEQPVQRFLAALVTGDRPSLESTLHREVSMVALLPARCVERVGPADVAGEILGWFDEVPEIVARWTRVERLADLWHASLRFDLRGIDPERVVEQHAYCRVADGVITSVRLMCSGFQPVPARDRSPAVDRCLDALGDGCATLTPRIAAALRDMTAGEVLAVLTDDPAAPDGIAAWSRLTGHRVVYTAAESGGTRYYLRHA